MLHVEGVKLMTSSIWLQKSPKIFIKPQLQRLRGLFTGRSRIVMGVAGTADNQPAITSHTQETLSLAETGTQPEVGCVFVMPDFMHVPIG